MESSRLLRFRTSPRTRLTRFQTFRKGRKNWKASRLENAFVMHPQYTRNAFRVHSQGTRKICNLLLLEETIARGIRALMCDRQFEWISDTLGTDGFGAQALLFTETLFATSAVKIAI